LDITLVCTKRKTAQEQDTVTIQCGDRSVVCKAWSHEVMPHEMVHYAVERVFPLRGFVRFVAAGNDPKQLETRHAPTEAIHAEMLTNAFQYELDGMTPADDEHFLATLGSFYAKSSLEPFQPATAQFRAGRGLLQETRSAWEALAPGESMTLSLPVEPGAGAEKRTPPRRCGEV
jgi:hypothetical protein